MAFDRGLHRVEVPSQRTDIRKGLRVQQDAFVTAQILGHAARLFHDVEGQGASLACDRKRRDGDH
jgi:hypothetical protein